MEGKKIVRVGEKSENFSLSPQKISFSRNVKENFKKTQLF